MTSCNLISSTIDGEKVNIDDKTKIYTFKDNKTKVSGTVVFYDIDPKTTKKYKSSLREIKDGKRINKGFDYFSSGAIQAEMIYDQNGLLTGTVKTFYENGSIWETEEYKNNHQDGVYKEYKENGIQSKEILYKNDIKIKEYTFDENGNKIIPAIDKLELVTYKTGFFKYIDFNSNQLLYEPMVIMKWKNKSDQAITEEVKIEGVFINNSNKEEMSQASDYFQNDSEVPLQQNLSRQSVLQSNVG